MKLRVVWVFAVSAWLVGACSSDDDDAAGATPEPIQEAATEEATDLATESPEPTSTATEEPTQAPTATLEPTATPTPAPVLRILVTNDDGVGAEGIDLVVEALLTLPDVEVIVVAPAENQSGSANRVTDPAPTAAEEATTLSGYESLAVVGTPSDSVNYALEYVFTDAPPDLVVSGSNEGQNFGPFSAVSGTVGAARTAAVNGIPAFAISQGALVDDVEPDYEAGIPFLLEWVEENRDAVLAFDGAIGEVWSLNIPTCGATGALRGLVVVPIAEAFPEDVNILEVDCTSTLTDPTNDVEAFRAGYATLSQVPETLVTAAPPS